jgi:BlaI family transcriptional regulator, penicillinase repressor
MMTTTQLGRVQLLIMQVLWDRGRATAREITDQISQAEPIAHSTVQTLLRGLEEKGAADHDTEGRTFTFFPLVAESEFKQSATQELLHRVFGGSVEGLMTHLLENESVSEKELAELRKLINRQSRKKS